MNWQVTPVAGIYAAAILVSLVTGVITWRYHPARGARLLAMVAFSGTIWGLGYLLGFFNADLMWKKHMIRVEYLGIAGAAYFFFLFALAFTSYDRWLTRTTVIVLAILPTLGYLMALTHDLHPLLYQSFGLTTVNGLVVTEKTYGIGFWVWVAYNYLMILGAAILLITDVVRHPRMFKGQANLLVAASIIPVLTNVSYVVGFNPFRPYDLSSVSFVVSAVLTMIAMTRFRLLDLRPVAHDLVFRSISSGVVIVNAEGRILDMNPAAEQILGRTLQSAIGKFIRDVFPEHKDLITRFRDVTEARTQIVMGENNRIYDMQIAPLHDRNRSSAGTGSPAGEVIGRAILLTDITEREQLIAELNAYAHTVAHDLKTPISSIMGFTDLLRIKLGGALTADAAKMTDSIINSTQKMNTITNALLLLAELRRPDDIPCNPIDMAAIVNDALHRVEHHIREAQAEIIRPESWPDGMISFAPWIEEIWVNYIGNALKYGGTPPRIELGATVLPEGGVRFWVKDNGPGMTPEEQALLFSEFTRLVQHTWVKGHGLGLSIVQRIATRLGGSAGVESTPGAGSTFYFVLPLMLPAPNTEPPAVDSAGVVSKPQGTEGQSIST
jgi:PAS domain S-box-containing protein